MNIKTNAAVVRTKNIGNDRCCWLLTENYGVINLYLKGAGGVKSKFASSTQLFCYGEAILFQKGDKFSLDSFDVQNSHHNLQKDLTKLALCSYFCEAICEVAGQGQPCEEYLSLLLNCFFLVEKGEKDFSFIKTVFEMRTMTISGFMPDLVYCARCHNEILSGTYFSISEGSCICEHCKGKNEGGLFLSNSCVFALRHIFFSEARKIFSFQISDTSLKKLAEFSEQFFLFYMGRSFKTLEFYHSVL